MFRKLILTAALAAATVTGFATNPTAAEASPPVHEHGHRHGFEVLHRCGWRWEVYGHYGNRHEAERVAQFLRHRGEIVQIRPC